MNSWSMCLIVANIFILVGCILPTFTRGSFSRCIEKEIILVCASSGVGLYAISAALQNYNQDGQNDLFFLDDSTVALLTPFIVQLALKSSNIHVVILAWTISFLSLIIADIALQYKSPHHLFPLFSLLVGVAMYDLEKRHRELLTTIEIEADETKVDIDNLLSDHEVLQKENSYLLSQIIVNVTHDLLTPIQGLGMGLDSLLSSIGLPNSVEIEFDEAMEVIMSMKGSCLNSHLIYSHHATPILPC